MGTVQVDCFEELELCLQDTPELLEIIAIPVRNLNSIDWCAPHRNLKLTNEFNTSESRNIISRMNRLVNLGLEKSRNYNRRMEFLECLLTHSTILSNGKKEAIIWGYEQNVSNQIPKDQVVTKIEDAVSNIETRRKDQGGSLGKLTISLVWDTDDDLGFHVLEPIGEQIGFSSKKSKSGGELDADANAETVMENPFENIYWNSPPSGMCRVLVNCYERKSSPENVGIPYQILDINDNHRKYKSAISSTKVLEEIPVQVLI